MRDPVKRAAAVERLRKAGERPEVRAAASARMKRLNNQMRLNDAMKAKCLAGRRRACDAAARDIQRAVMTELMGRPEMKAKARAHAVKMNRDPAMRVRQWEGRRRKAKQADCPVSDLK